MPTEWRKKKTLLNEDNPGPILKINVNSTVAPENNPTNNSAKPIVEQAVTTPVQRSVSVEQASTLQNNKTQQQTTAAAAGFQRPASISITKSHPAASANVSSGVPIQKQEQIVLNDDFTDVSLEQAWRNFGLTIKDDIKKINFQNTNLPKRISKNEFEITVNNVMQETELKKIQTDIIQYMIGFLRNSSIKMIIRINEESEIQKSVLPEDLYKMMMDQNPVLEKLRKNLSLEID